MKERQMEIYNKYKIEHTDGTPIKGKQYFVLRLDSDDPLEAARVARAMRAYQGKLRNCDVGTLDGQFKRYHKFCMGGHGCSTCKVGIRSGAGCSLAWAQLPYTEEGAK